MGWDALVGLAADACHGVFGRPIAFRRISADPEAPAIEVEAIYQAAYQRLDTSAGVPISAVGPALEIRHGSLGFAPDQGDRVEIDGTVYTIVDVQPDGAGSSLCLLHKGTKAGWG